ncbi:patatin-like phospholipase family protein [candidate division CSSED10-310 bacterium]|uniref:Patatin-like phospholipase family protein n=1 Tax=candidate division CSSED10-310 bacterium TaxID=2855610 RepID=A0ABV6YY55_UNCC1
MERILFFINAISIEDIIQAIKKDSSLEVSEQRSREILIRRRDLRAGEPAREYLFSFSKSMSETLLKLRKKYFNLVVVDERSAQADASESDFNDLLIPLLYKIEQEPNIDKRYSLSRIIILLDQNPYLPEKTFELGRLQIGSYVTQPFVQSRLLHRIDELLHQKRGTGKKALCIAGGGLEGLLYELGVLRALNSLFKNCRVTDFDIFCGISSGAFISAILANGIQPEEFIKAFEGKTENFDAITAQTIYDLNFSGYVSRWLSFWKNMSKFPNSSVSLFSSIIKSFPNGICKGEKLREFLRKQLNKSNYSDDFRKLNKELYIGATNMDSFEHVVFGDEGWRDLPISTAVRASSAMEPIYSPAKIGHNYYIDGAFTRTTNFELAVRKGANLVIIIDPLVPIKTEQSGYVMNKGGIFSTIQGVKGLVASRFDRGYSFAKKQYPHVDFYVFKPRGEDMRLMSGSPMKYKIRLGIVKLAFEDTIKRITDDFDIFYKGFMKHGIEITKQVVSDEEVKLRSGDINTIKAILENSTEYRNHQSTNKRSPEESMQSFYLGSME